MSLIDNQPAQQLDVDPKYDPEKDPEIIALRNIDYIADQLISKYLYKECVKTACLRLERLTIDKIAVKAYQNCMTKIISELIQEATDKQREELCTKFIDNIQEQVI